MTDADFIIVGGGSAGCVLANRLSADPRNNVLLLEAGGRDTSPMIHMPMGVTETVPGKAVNWQYWTVPQKHLNSRRMYQPRGKVLGGSSSINGMLCIRGHRSDYEGWRDAGCVGWGYADVLPYFKKLESHERDDPEFHGKTGPLKIRRNTSTNALGPATLSAAAEAGFPATDDFNGRDFEGFGTFDVNIVNGRRQSTAVAFLGPALKRPNLRVITGAHVTRIHFKGKQATGVECVAKGTTCSYSATREIILAGGTINSPQVLQLSGVGDPEGLKRVGIPVQHSLPGVGNNLQDHLDYMVAFAANAPISYYRLQSPINRVLGALKWFLGMKSFVGEAFCPVCAFLKSSPENAVPDIQLHLFPAIADKQHGFGKVTREGFGLHICALRPKSRGTITLSSPDPFAAPNIDPNYLDAPEDLTVMRAGVRLMRKLAAAPSLSQYVEKELDPGVGAQSDAAIDAAIREKAETIYHPVGTCRMGPASDPASVVDPQLRAIGLAGLRVVDASIMPTIISGNTNLPTIMIAEKAADMILGTAS